MHADDRRTRISSRVATRWQLRRLQDRTGEQIRREALVAPNDDATLTADDDIGHVARMLASGACNSSYPLMISAIGEGLDLARAIDRHLTGSSRLRPNLLIHRRPLSPDGWNPTG